MSEGWLLGESFGSQVAWQIVERKQFKVSGIILAGGFVRHPFGNTARVVGKIAGRTSITLRTRLLRRYTQIARFRFRRAPETISDLREFIARRTELDYQAIKHRLDLVADSDPRPVARKTKIPVYALSGFFDPIVPPFPVRSWLRRHCPCLRDYRVVWAADHNVLNCAPRAAAEQVVEWMNDEPS
jgi:pimeloyl-ACP methyl ester carboxylesterase